MGYRLGGGGFFERFCDRLIFPYKMVKIDLVTGLRTGLEFYFLYLKSKISNKKIFLSYFCILLCYFFIFL